MAVSVCLCVRVCLLHFSFAKIQLLHILTTCTGAALFRPPPPPRQHIRTEGSSMKFYRIPNVECVRKDNTCTTLTIDSCNSFLARIHSSTFPCLSFFCVFFLVTRCHHPYLSLWNLTIKIRWPIKYGN